jgi:hypothetical protein
MLDVRLGGDPGESQELLRRLRSVGVEVQVNRVKPRSEGITHTYAVALVVGYEPDGGTAAVVAPAATGAAGVVRVPSTTGRALPAGDRRPRRRR